MKGKNVLITGASSGIGAATALEFARAGANLVLAARRTAPLEEVAARCRELGVRAEIAVADVSQRDSCIALVQTAEEKLGKVDILVNNAGFGIFDPVEAASADDVQNMMQTNFFGMFHCTQAALPAMLERGDGAIVNVASIAGLMGYERMSGYCASKFAIVGFTEALRDEVVDRGVRVALVCPGTTSTDFFVQAEVQKIPKASRLVMAMSAETVARKILRAAAYGSYRKVAPFPAAVYMRFKEVAPRSAHFLMRHVSRLLERRWR